jgi:hypothetical protein
VWIAKKCIQPRLNRSTLKMEKWRGAIDTHQGRRGTGSNGDATVLWVVRKLKNNSR